jgi:hypothetical protein
LHHQTLQIETVSPRARRKYWVGVFAFLCFTPLSALAQDPAFQPPGLLPGMNEEMLVDPTTFDISGGWSYSSDWGSGLFDIYQSGGEIVLEIISGSTCDPEEMCTLTGAIDGKALLVYVTASVPDGGQAASSFAIYFESETEARGMGTSVWQGGGQEMRWDYLIDMWRPGTRD